MKKAETEISVSTLRDELPNILSRVALLGESFAIIKHGKKYAVIRPVGDETEHVERNRSARRPRPKEATYKP